MERGIRVRHPSKAFTYLELLIALAIFVSGTVFLLDAFNIGVFSVSDIRRSLTSLYLANEKLESLDDQSFSGVLSESRAAVSGFSGYDRSVTVTSRSPNLKEVSVSVFYTVKGGNEKTLTVTSLRANK